VDSSTDSGPVRVKDVEISHIAFGVTDWSAIDPVRHSGESGHAQWRTRQFGDMRIRMVHSGGC
jgi:hypothetical protein